MNRKLSPSFPCGADTAAITTNSTITIARHRNTTICVGTVRLQTNDQGSTACYHLTFYGKAPPTNHTTCTYTYLHTPPCLLLLLLLSSLTDYYTNPTPILVSCPLCWFKDKYSHGCPFHRLAAPIQSIVAARRSCLATSFKLLHALKCIERQTNVSRLCIKLLSAVTRLGMPSPSPPPPSQVDIQRISLYKDISSIDLYNMIAIFYNFPTLLLCPYFIWRLVQSNARQLLIQSSFIVSIAGHIECRPSIHQSASVSGQPILHGMWGRYL